MKPNRLYYGDNLDLLRLREHFPDECVDLIYLDPPFNSSRNYNVLFEDTKGEASDAQIVAFKDTWEWGDIALQTYHHLGKEAAPPIVALINSFKLFMGETALFAYLLMMTIRLIELHRVLKPTGSLYLHCDPTAGHYLKIVLDAVFGREQFRNEIIWKRTTAHSDSSQGQVLHAGRIHDVIYYYTKTDNAFRREVYSDYDEAYINKIYKYTEPETGRRYTLDNITGPGGASKGNPRYEFLGVTRYWRYSRENMEELYKAGRIVQTKAGNVPRYKRYLDEMQGLPLQDIWDDIKPLSAQAKERLGYPTQKPVALLERIILTSSDEGGVVLDPFCGCGTAVVAAQKLGRQWIGIDITHLSIALMKYRLEDMFDLKPNQDYAVFGEPTTLSGARQLAQDNRYQFQFWATSLVEAKPLGGETGKREGKKGKDRGIDGLIHFYDGIGAQARYQSVLIQVKSGKVKSGDIRDLRGTIERENAAIGVFITLEAPSKDMLTEALDAEYYSSPLYGKNYRKIQILTIEDLMAGAKIDMPPRESHIKAAERLQNHPEQNPLL